MKKLLYTIILLIISWSFTSCELLDDGCQICQTVTYENDNPIAWGTEAEYCGQELLAIKAIPPSTAGGTTTRWECY
ncbi:MAG: hypothetical protein GX622_04265 [Bacteroidales bacterium]|nr:hypothetical protein [Bacteroidales bacterium]